MRFTRSKLYVGGLLAVAALFSSVAAQANLVTNGDFETGDFTGWDANGTTIYDGVDDSSPQAGNYAAFFGNPVGISSITQTINTYGPGGVYDVSFWLKSEADANGVATPNSFEFDWDGAQALLITDAPASGYTQYTFVLTSTSAATDLTFKFGQQPAFWDFDSVVVENHVPEPGSLALLGLAGVLAFAASRRRAA